MKANSAHPSADQAHCDSDSRRTGLFNMKWQALQHFVPLECVDSVKHCFVGPQKSLQFQPKWRFLALKFETFCYYNCFYAFLLRLTVILAKSLKNWSILIRMAVILVEIGCTLEKCMLFSLTGSKMLQFSNLKTTVQECQRKQKQIPHSEIKELHCNKVPLIRNYARNYPFKTNMSSNLFRHSV